MGFFKNLINDAADELKKKADAAADELKKRAEVAAEELKKRAEDAKNQAAKNVRDKLDEMLSDNKAPKSNNNLILQPKDNLSISMRKVRLSFNVDGDACFAKVRLLPIIDKNCKQLVAKYNYNAEQCSEALEDYLYDNQRDLPMDFMFVLSGTPSELIVTDDETDDELYDEEIEIIPSFGIMSCDEAKENYEDDEEELEKYNSYLNKTTFSDVNSYVSKGIIGTWDKLIKNDINGDEFVPSTLITSLKSTGASSALLHGESEICSSTITFFIEIPKGESFDPDKLNYINFDAEYDDYSSVLQDILADDFVSMNAIIYDGKMYFATSEDMNLGDNDGDDYYDIVNDELCHIDKISEDEIVIVGSNNSPEKVQLPNTKAGESHQQGLFSERLEAMISAALQDGILTQKEKEVIMRRAEKEGEDMDEFEILFDARIAEMGIKVEQPEPEVELDINNVEELQSSNPDKGPDGMFSERLEFLIHNAVQDGQITEQERNAIIRRAQAEGEDLDEVDIYIQSLLQKQKMGEF